MSTSFAPGRVVNGYQVVYLVGKGGFGEVYKVKDCKTQQMFAMKTERLDTPEPMLQMEIDILKSVSSDCFPKLRTSGEDKKVRYYVMNILGLSIGAIRKKQGDALPPTITLPVVKVMLSIVREFHKAGWIHRDIKPSNFLVQNNRAAPLVLIDFGLSIKYDPRGSGNKRHSAAAGTRKYLSCRANDQQEIGQFDDLISWFYSFVELWQGGLPWGDLKDQDDIFRSKSGTSVQELCTGMPEQCLQIYEHLMALKDGEMPGYDFISQKLDEMMAAADVNEQNFDWSAFYAANSNLGNLALTLSKEELGDGEAGEGGCCNVA
jgi:serine/threonine protein kinase